jgi:hypothetical protein
MLTNVNLSNCTSKTRINVNSLTTVLQDPNTPEKVGDVFHIQLFKAGSHSVTVAARLPVRKAVEHDANNIL